MEQIFITIVILTAVVGAVEFQNYSRDDVRVISGHHECISDCSLFSSDKKESVTCSIDECSRDHVSSSNGPRINITDVFFERFENQVMGNVKLALHIKWISADIENTKGFMLNITDGESNYVKCYNIDKVLSRNSSKDIFYNDCFGKEAGTTVKVGSDIRAEITPLPLKENDPDLAKVILDVEVPNCSNFQLFSLEECQSSGGIPVTQPCQNNCNTFSTVGNISYPILCNISKPTFSSTSIPRCPSTNRTVVGVSSDPKHVSKAQEWYKFIDEDTNEVKLALNFSWRHSGDSSLPDLLGYIYTIQEVSTPNVVGFYECTTIETPLIMGKHENAEYYSNCYGRKGATEVKPDGEYRVSLQSRRNPEPEHIKIVIPGCAHESMHDVTECKSHDLRILSKSDYVYCENLTVRYSYYVSSEYGNSAEVVLCEKGEHPSICKNVIQDFEGLQLSNTLYNLSIPSNSDRTIPYVVLVRGNNNEYSTRNSSNVDFSHCYRGTPISKTAIGLITVAILLFLVMLAISVWFLCFRDKCGFWIFKRYYPPPPEIHVSLPLPAEITAPAALPEKVRAYIVFAEDHHLHTEVVHWFCSFLKIELGIDAKVHIWERAQSATNRPEYLMSNLKNADRVVVICSEGTLDSNKGNQNMLTAAVSKIISDSLTSNNPEKYLVAYFGYSSVEHVPEHLRDSAGAASIFNLMDDFEKFYFRLVGVEQYQEGGILKINEINDYFDPEKRSEGGRKLHTAIANMSKFVCDYPSWYKDSHMVDGSGNGINSTSPQEPPGVDNTQLHERNINDQDTELPSISHLNARSPESINGAGARPKVKSTAPPQNAQPQPYQVSQYYPQTNQLPPPNPYHNGPMAAAQPYNGHAGNAFQWNPSQRQPLENSSVPAKEPCEHSTMPDSMESSFEIPDTEDLSSVSPSEAATKALSEPKSVKPEPLPAKPLNSLLYNPSFHPESFTSNDFGTGDFESMPDSHLMTNIPSNTTQMTNLGSLEPREPRYKGPASDVMTFLPSTATEMTSFGDTDAKLQEVDSLIDGVVVRRPSNEVSAESGLFTLAKIDEDELDLEDQIKSINLI